MRSLRLRLPTLPTRPHVWINSKVARDARTVVSISTTSYDPSVGWFSGFRTNVELEQGNLFSSRTVSTTIDAPFMQLPAGVGNESRFTNVRVSTGGDGMFWGDRTSYSYGAEAAQRSAAFLSIQSASAANLIAAGIDPDSAARFLRLAIPGRSAGTVGRLENATTRKASLIGRLDRAPYDAKTMSARNTVVAVTGNFDLTSSMGVGGGPLVSAERSSESTNMVAGVQGIYSKYITKRFLTDLRSSLSTRRSDFTAAAAIPAAPRSAVRHLASPSLLSSPSWSSRPQKASPQCPGLAAPAR